MPLLMVIVSLTLTLPYSWPRLGRCVLVYLAPEASEALVRRLGALLPCAACVVYEQIRPDDAFGRQMVINLEARPRLSRMTW